MKQFKFYLVKWPNKNKTITVTAVDSVEARRFVADEYPEWATSMFWPVNEPTTPKVEPYKTPNIPLESNPNLVTIGPIDPKWARVFNG